MARLTIRVPATKWGLWFRELVQQPELDQYDIAEMNLRCAVDLPGMNRELVGQGIDKINDWTDWVDDFTRKLWQKVRKVPGRKRTRLSEAQVCVGAMVECVQRQLGVKYNYPFAEGEYDGSDSRNLFIHGIVTGFGGTCASLPVVYCAIGRRLGYPIGLADTWEHAFCRWDGLEGESFCFDAAGRGFTAHPEDRYRQWPRKVTPKQERDNGFIRQKTDREELAAFAVNRGNCLIDNLQFNPALEAFALAHEMVPANHSLHDSYGLAIYTAQLWQGVERAQEDKQSLPVAIDLAARSLQGPDVDHFRKDVVKNIYRILENRNRRRLTRGHDEAMDDLFNN